MSIDAHATTAACPLSLTCGRHRARPAARAAHCSPVLPHWPATAGAAGPLTPRASPPPAAPPAWQRVSASREGQQTVSCNTRPRLLGQPTTTEHITGQQSTSAPLFPSSLGPATHTHTQTHLLIPALHLLLLSAQLRLQHLECELLVAAKGQAAHSQTHGRCQHHFMQHNGQQQSLTNLTLMCCWCAAASACAACSCSLKASACAASCEQCCCSAACRCRALTICPTCCRTLASAAAASALTAAASACAAASCCGARRFGAAGNGSEQRGTGVSIGLA